MRMPFLHWLSHQTLLVHNPTSCQQKHFKYALLCVFPYKLKANPPHHPLFACVLPSQGPTFAQSVLDKIALATPSAGVTEGFAPMPRATTATITAPAAPADNTTKSMNKDTALVGGTTNSSEGATATCTIIMPHERTEHTSVDFLPTSQHVAATPDGDAAAAAEAAAVAVQVVVTAAPPPVSDVASRAVYVLQRTIIRCVDGGQEGFGGRVRFVARKVVLEHAYQAMWQLSTRFWHGMDIPGRLCCVCCGCKSCLGWRVPR